MKNRMIHLLLVYSSLVIIHLCNGGYAPLLKNFAQHHDINPLVLYFYRDLGGSLVMFLGECA